MKIAIKGKGPLGLFISIMLVIVVFFQNCAEGMQSNIDGSSLNDSNSGQTLREILENIDITPEIYLQISSGPEIYEGSNFALVSLIDFNGFSYQWFFEPESQNRVIELTGATTPLFQVVNCDSSHNGVYWLRVTDNQGVEQESNRIQISVTEYLVTSLSVSFDSHPSSLTRTEGVDVVLNSSASSMTGSVEYNWQIKRAGEQAFSDIPVNEPGISGQQTQQLTITDFRVADVATYRVRATNGQVGADYREAFSGQSILSFRRNNTPSNNLVSTGPDYIATLSRRIVTIMSGNRLSANSEIQWQKRRIDTGAWSLFRQNGDIVTGQSVDITVNTNHNAYRTRLINAFDQRVSGQINITHPWNN